MGKSMKDNSLPKKGKIIVKKGEIFYADLGQCMGSEQSGLRPVIIIQNDIGNKYSPTTIVATITSANKKMNLPVHMELPKDLSNLPQNSVILLEQIRTIDKKRLIKKVSSLDTNTLDKLNNILKISLGIL